MKKSQVDPFDLGQKLGYYLVSILIMFLLFTFFSILILGFENSYYKSSFGSNIMGFEERIFTCISYTDPLTNKFYPKLISAKIITDFESTDKLDDCMGFETQGTGRGIKIEIKSSQLDKKLQTSRYVDKPIITKHYPIQTIEENKIESGVITIKYWAP